MPPAFPFCRFLTSSSVSTLRLGGAAASPSTDDVDEVCVSRLGVFVRASVIERCSVCRQRTMSRTCGRRRGEDGVGRAGRAREVCEKRVVARGLGVLQMGRGKRGDKCVEAGKVRRKGVERVTVRVATGATAGAPGWGTASARACSAGQTLKTGPVKSAMCSATSSERESDVTAKGSGTGGAHGLKQQMTAPGASIILTCSLAFHVEARLFLRAAAHRSSRRVVPHRDAPTGPQGPPRRCARATCAAVAISKERALDGHSPHRGVPGGAVGHRWFEEWRRRTWTCSSSSDPRQRATRWRRPGGSLA